MLMSKSRLEKFLYALYSLDSSDLPTPLSRIEELYNCWVTGVDGPTFKPLSRVEKYLMAILGTYDVDSLPNPLSRVEVLLHKLAIGDDNLDDVKSLLSEHEELLAEIIRNGGVGGNIDIEYVLYTLSTEFNTLYNTAEKPVKSAILKGNTLVNMVKNQDFTLDSSDGYNRLYTLNVPVKLNTTYTIYISLNCAHKITTTKETVFRIKKNNNNGEDLIDPIQFDTSDTTSSTELKVTIQNVDGEYFHIRSYNFKIENVILMLLEGDHSSEDIPYFEGIVSVKMPVLKVTGKNLFDGELEQGGLTTDTGLPFTGQLDRYRSKNYTKVKTSTPYVVYNNYSSMIGIREFDENYNLVSWITVPSSTAFTTSNNTKYLKFIIVNPNDDNLVQLEEGSIVTTYEPHKSNILTVNEDVTLRSNGDVYDELNLLTGRLTQRIDENNEVLAQEVVKTVDLSTVNQDGNNTKLSTFNDVTHVTLSSEGLIPEAELEVATKNEEVLNTMSLEMDDISATQTTLEETSNTQSENVDATMIATTEIYEQLL